MADPLVVLLTIGKTLWTVLQAVVYSLIGLFWALIPYKLLKHKNVEGEIVLITGAGSGLGRLMALRFALLDATIVLWDINKVDNDETARQVESIKGISYPYVVDCSNNEEVYKAAERVKNEVGDVTILINNAGVVSGKTLLECPDNLIKRTMDVNVNAHLWTLKAFLPAMLSHNHGHVVTIASLAGHFGTKGLVEYCASKFAAVGIDESLKYELIQSGKSGVKTTVICPYFINTGMFEGVTSKKPWLLPILEPEYVADIITEAILTNTEMVVLPKITKLLLLLKPMVSTRGMLQFYRFVGLDSAMDNYIGKQGDKVD